MNEPRYYVKERATQVTDCKRSEGIGRWRKVGWRKRAVHETEGQLLAQASADLTADDKLPDDI
jgi:hypothetical protein